MVVNIAIKGGLGNQLFQYALGNYLHETHGASVFYDLKQLDLKEENLTPRIFLLDKLFDHIRFISDRTHRIFYWQNNLLLRWYNYAVRKLSTYIYVPETDPTALKLNSKATYYFDGYWQRADLARLLAPKLNAATERILHNNTYLAQIIAGEETVALHIRRGDYVENTFINNYHGNCDLNYYLKAMAQIEQQIKVSRFFVFSDDLPWAKENIRSAHPLVFVEGNDAITDLLLMKSCRHQILSNSSFSCWASYLNANPKKIIVAPVNWTRKEKTGRLPLSEHSWILI